MTTNALVRSAWASKVMGHDQIVAYTPQIFDYDLTEESTKEQSKLFHDTIVNCVSYVVSSYQQLRLRGTNSKHFEVKVTYYKQYDVDGDNYKSIADFFELLQTLVWSELGGTWDASVDYYQLQEGPPSIRVDTIGGRKSWVGEFLFRAEVSF